MKVAEQGNGENSLVVVDESLDEVRYLREMSCLASCLRMSK